MKNPQSRRAKSGKSTPPSSASESAPIVSPAIFSDQSGSKTPPVAGFVSDQLAPTINGLDEELHNLAGHLSNPARRSLARKLTRWAQQLEATAPKSKSRRTSLPAPLDRNTLAAN